VDNGLNFKKMRNKLNLKEGEVQRILGLHKKAINENLNIFSTNKPVLSEAVKYSQKSEHFFERIKTAMKQGEKQIKNFYLPDKTKWKETKDGAKTKIDDYNGTKVFFKCKKYNNFDFLVDEANRGKYVWFKSEKLGSVLRGKFCKNKSADEGSSDFGNDKKQGYAYTYIPGGNFNVSNTTTANTPGQNMYFRCDAYKKDYHFKYGKVFHKNETLTKKFKSVFCSSNKPSYKQEIKQTFVSENNTKFSLGANTVWKWKNTGKEEVIPDPNSGKNEEGKDGLVVAGSSGTRYSFDFETIMKAIDDTGKCPRSGTSDQAGTSGTSGVQGTSGTQGTSGVGDPVVIQKPTVTKDDFYQWTMD
jgi:hypothetical protein